MNFQGKAVLVYLQEDNIPRAYFRVRPLLLETGPVPPEALNDFPDEGFLRIVPDKNEQHTFKERMRSLCGLCLLDLRFLPSESNKIRTNKNYSPSRGENNQFIVYSDAIRALPDQLVFQVVAEDQIASAFTPQVYVRKGANIQGPFCKDTAQPVGDAAPLPPDSRELFSATIEDQEYLFYWPRTEAAAPAAPYAAAPAPAVKPATAPMAELPPVAAAPAEAPAAAPVNTEETRQNAYKRIQEMNAGVAPSESANRLHDEKPTPMDFVPDQPQRPLVGTRLYQAPFRAAVPRRAHNPLMEVVEQQRYAARYEAPGAVLPQNAELKDVQNPVDAFKRSLSGICQTPEAQKQAVDTLLAQPGMRSILSRALSAGKSDITLSAMHSQLQELEAERLMTLMQLDDVKKNLSGAREELVGKLHQDEQKKLDVLKAAREAEKKAAEALRASMEEILAQRQEAAEFIGQAGLLRGTVTLAPTLGKAAEKQVLIRQTVKAFTAAGFKMEADDAEALLILLAQSEGRLQINADTRADAFSAAQTLGCALGAAVGVAKSGTDKVHILPGGDTAALVLDQEDALAPVAGALLLSLRQSSEAATEYPAEYGLQPYAQFTCETNAEALPMPLPDCDAVRFAALREEMLKGTELNTETKEALCAVRRALKESGCALPLQTAAKMAQFVAAAQNDLKGGVAEALDRAVLCWAVPHIQAYQLEIDALLPVLSAMPRTLKALKKA